MANTYLSRTFSTPTNGKKFTFSAWMKRSSISGDQAFFSTATGTPITTFRWNSDNKIYLFQIVGSSMVWEFATNALYRDINGWYHLVIAFDSTESSAGDRLKLWINGEQVTSWSTQVNPALDMTPTMNTAIRHDVANNRDGNYFNGSMSYVAFVDGTAELPTIFGETDSVTGQWKIKTDITPSVAWGNNGFLILKNGNSLTDESTNTNNFTLGGGTLTNTEDNPSNVFVTLNNLDNDNLGGGFAYGNTYISGQASESRKYYCGLTLGMMGDGKYYFEGQLNVNNQGVLGVCNLDASDNPTYLRQQNTFPGRYSSSFGYDFTDGGYFNNNNKTAYGGTSWTANDYFSFALDNTNGKMYIAKNGSWVNSGNPTNGTGGIDYSAIGDNNMFIVSDNNGAGYNKFFFNFGNGYFGTTAVASAGTNASGIGIFEYDVPTGYTALSTKGLNL
jgi:hypothetical protein